jgi:hypothetical protein
VKSAERGFARQKIENPVSKGNIHSGRISQKNILIERVSIIAKKWGRNIYTVNAIQNRRSFLLEPAASLYRVSNMATKGRTAGYSILDGYSSTAKEFQ